MSEQILLDPDGEGIFLLSGGDFIPNLLMYASNIFFGNINEYKNLDIELKYMMENKNDELWYEACTGEFSKHWKLNLPKKYRPSLYMYCKPKAGL
jgi:hypothetical protein